MERRKFITDIAKLSSLALIERNLVNTDLFSIPNKVLHSQNALQISTNKMNIDSIYENVTTTVKLRGIDVKIHALCTGTVAVKTNFLKKKGLGELAKLNIIVDPNYTAYLPIWVFVIEHPDGTIVIDTGENAQINNLDQYLANESKFLRYQFKHACKFKIDPKEELNYQFEKINFKLDDVKLVVLTHLHVYHTDGLKFFPKQEIIVGNYEFNNPNHNMPSTIPSWFKPNTVKYKSDIIEFFNEAYPINISEDLLYIPTPGHTLGHSSLLFKTDDFDIFFAGDSSYNQNQVLNGEIAGVNASYRRTLSTYKKIVDYASNRKTIYLPTHDENAGKRLANLEFII